MKFFCRQFEIRSGTNMEITRIDETSQATVSQDVKMKKRWGKVCIYYPEASCAAPRLQFKICRGCPKCAQYVRKNVVRSIFDHVKSIAISMLNTNNSQFSK
ncbi:MAG: hypothetical protein ABIA67_03615 [Candidatus Margulisiibacteriota bacterium]